MQIPSSIETSVRLRKTTTLAIIVGSGLVLTLGFAMFTVTTNAAKNSKKQQPTAAVVPASSSNSDALQAMVDTCYEYNWDTMTASEGKQTIIAKAVASDGQEVITPNRQLFVDNFPFSVYISDPPSGYIATGPTIVRIEPNGLVPPISAIRVFRDGFPIINGYKESPPWEVIWNAQSAPPGNHFLYAEIWGGIPEDHRYTPQIPVTVQN